MMPILIVGVVFYFFVYQPGKKEEATKRELIASRRVRHEAAGRKHAVRRMADAGEGFGARELLLSKRDLRLIPEFDPVVAQRLAEIDGDALCGCDRRIADLLRQQDRVDRRVTPDAPIGFGRHVEGVPGAALEPRPAAGERHEQELAPSARQ